MGEGAFALREAMGQDDHVVCSNFAEIKQNLDPAASYLIFEKSAKPVNPLEFGEILENFSPFKKDIDTHGIYYDQIHERLMLIVKVLPKRKDQIINMISNQRLPDNVDFYIYGSRP